MEIKKSVINQILDTYSTKPKEFETFGNIEHKYQSRIVKGYVIAIEPERRDEIGEETGRIIVKHTSTRGKRVFNDVWEKDGNGGYYWLCRNPKDTPIADAIAYREMENELDRVKAAARELQKEYSEMKKRLENSEGIKNASQIIETERTAGRPKETEKQKERAAEIKRMLDAGKTNTEIMETLEIKKATFYRLKKLIGA